MLVDSKPATTAPLKITGFDRCDRCIAKAMVIASKNGHELFFCGHHIREYEPALIAQGFAIWEDQPSNHKE